MYFFILLTMKSRNNSVIIINDHESLELNYQKYYYMNNICESIWKLNERYIYNDPISAKIINDSVTTSIDHEKYILKSIKYKYDIILEKLLKHMFFQLMDYKSFENIKLYALNTNNLSIIQLFYKYIPNLQYTINNRLYIIKNKKLVYNKLYTKSLYKIPLYLITYSLLDKKAIDCLFNINDIINNYEIFEGFTKISLYEINSIENIELFLNRKLEESNKKNILKLKEIYIKRYIKLKNTVIKMLKNKEYIPKIHKYTFQKQEKIIYSNLEDTDTE